MTITEFIGCSFIGFGPPIILFISTLSQDPLLIIVWVASAFFWILSLLISASWWMIVFPLKNFPAFGLCFSVLFQELFRYFFYLLMRVAEKGLRQVWVMDHDNLETSLMSSTKLSFVAGLGYGTVSCTFSLVNLLASLYGPATVGLSNNHQDFYISSAFLSLAFFLLHTFWNVIFFDGFKKKRYHQVVVVVASHLLISLLTLSNQYLGPLLSVMISYLMVVLAMMWSFVIAGGTRKAIRNSVRIEAPPS